MNGGDAFAGAVTVDDAALELTSATALGAAPITFGPDGGLLRIDGSTMPANTISGFGVGDIIDLAGVSFDPQGSATLGGRQPAGDFRERIELRSAARSRRQLWRSDLQPAERSERGDRRGIGNRGARRGQQRWGWAVAFQRASVERRRCHRALRRHHQRAVNLRRRQREHCQRRHRHRHHRQRRRHPAGAAGRRRQRHARQRSRPADRRRRRRRDERDTQRRRGRPLWNDDCHDNRQRRRACGREGRRRHGNDGRMAAASN